MRAQHVLLNFASMASTQYRSMTQRSSNVLMFCFFAALVFFAKLPILTAPFRTVNRRSILPPRGCATSPARRGLRRYLNIELLKDQQMEGAITV
jgi:hypothetical protein